MDDGQMDITVLVKCACQIQLYTFMEKSTPTQMTIDEMMQ